MSHLLHDAALQALSPAKINLTLDVLGARADGYHDIDSVVLGVDLCDTVKVTRTAGGAFSLSTDSQELPDNDPSNLIVRAARMLADAASQPVGAHVSLVKRIPIGSGLGGGSGNAATVLQLLNRIWELDLDAAELARLGANIGSDVPLFFHLPAAVVRGRGEVVKPLHLSWNGYVVLVFAGQPVSTADVYRRWRPACERSRRERVTQDIARCTTAGELASLTRNDLEAAVFESAPEVRALHQAVQRHSVSPFRVSGAGQTVYALFDDESAARSLCEKLVNLRIGTGAVVVRTLTGPLTASEDQPWKSPKFV